MTAFPCEHAYVPTRIGALLEYDWTGSGGTAGVTMRLDGVRHDGDDTVLVWSIETRSDHGVSRITLDRACDRTGAEEPWLGLGFPPGATLSDQTWRMPRSPGIEFGDRYGGTFELGLAGVEVTISRTHIVRGPETIHIGGTSYPAVRVELSDRTEHGAEAISSVAWLSPDIGLVRMVVARGTSSEALYELRSFYLP